jgi:uncharacterized membrane protein YidH (DUF202 family)
MWAAMVHDRGSLAWIVVAGYAAGALLAFVAAARADGRERTFWIGTAIGLVLLGINKQLDLQTDLTTVARAAALSEGWYGDRRDAQGAFILLIALATPVCGLLLWMWLRKAAASVKAAAAGFVVLFAFIFIRAASFHHIDYWVTINVAGLRSGWWLELVGIGIICAAALRYRSSRGTPLSPASGRTEA